MGKQRHEKQAAGQQDEQEEELAAAASIRGTRYRRERRAAEAFGRIGQKKIRPE